MRYIAKALLLLLLPLSAVAQTTVSATITDSDGQVWANGHGFATFVPGPINSYKCASPVVSPTNFTLDGTGSFSVSLADNSTCRPVGSQWVFTICPNASAACYTSQQTVFGATQNLSGILSAASIAPRFAATSSVQSFGYLDTEVSPNPLPGGWYFNVTSAIARQWNGSAWQNFGGGGGGTVTPCGASGSGDIQTNASSSSLGCDPAFSINSTTHTLNAAANLQINALSSLPRAVYDPMDTRYCTTTGTSACGLQAALGVVSTNPSAPTQVIQAAIDAGECALLTHSTTFPGIDIPLPARVTIPIGGLLMWANSSIGGGDGLFTSYPNLVHNDATQYMISTHSGSDTITCSDGSHTPGQTTGVYVHDMEINGMGAVATNTDVGIYLNGSDAVVRNIQGGSIFGSSAVFIGNITSYGDHLGFPGGNLQGCATYNQGVLPVSSYTIGSGVCGSVAEYSVDGGAEFIYATDGMAIVSGHPAGPCYPNCAAVVAAGPGSFLLNVFAQISSIDTIIANSSVKAETLRLDWTSREALRLNGGNANVSDVEIDSPCSDTALQANFNAGTATGCGAVYDAGQGNVVSNVQVRVNDPFFSTSYDQCWIYDTLTGASGISNIYSGVPYQGNTGNTTANSWAYCGAFGGDQVSGRVDFPSMAPMQASTTTPNVSGITAITLQGQTVTNMVAGIPGQEISVYGPGTVNNQAGGVGDIINSNGLPVTLSSTQVVQYRYIATPAVGQHWQMTSGPPQLTPTHVNYSGNPTPSNPSLLDVYGNEQSRQVPLPSFGGGFQLSGATTTGQACFVLETLFPDNSHAVSPQTCTTTALPTTGGAIFGSGPNTVNGAVQNLWLISDTQPTTVPLGKFPAITCTPTCFWSNTVVQAGGNGATPVVANDNTTGQNIAAGGEIPNLNGIFYVDANSPSSCTVNGTSYSTNFDCAFQQAKYWVTIHSNLNATVRIGSNGILTTLLGAQMPTAAGNHGTVNIIGQGVNASYLQLTGSLGTTCMVTQPDEATAGNSAYQRIEGLTLDLNSNSQCAMSIDGVKSSRYANIRIINVATSTPGSGGAAVKFADTVQAGQVFDTTLDSITVDSGGAGGYTAAGFTCTNLASPGNPVCTVTSGGSYPSNTGNQVQTWGTGNGSGACLVYPTWTVTYSGSGPYVVTGLTASGGTCSGTVYPSLSPSPVADYVFKFLNEFTDNDVNYLRAVMPTNFATLQVKGHPNIFKHYHPYSGQPVGIEDYGGDIWQGTECDTVGGFCAAIEGLGSIYVQTSSLYNNFTGNQGSGLFYVDTSVTSVPTFNSIGVTCNGNRQTRGGYSKLVIGNGLPYNNTSTTGGAIENGVAIPNGGIEMEDTLDCGTSPTTNTFYSHIGSMSILFGGILGPATAPTGTCTAAQSGFWELTNDGKASYCPSGGGTWTLFAGGGGGGTIGGSGTTGFFPSFASGTTIGNSHMDDGVTTANTITSTEPITVADGSGIGGGFRAAQPGTAPTPGSGYGTMWMDSTFGYFMMNNENSGPAAVVGAQGAITGTHCAAFATSLTNYIVDSGLPCNAAAMTGTPSVTPDSGAGGTPSVSIINTPSTSNDGDGSVSVTPGSSPIGGNVGLVTIVYGGLYSVVPKCSITWSNPAAAALSGATQVYVSSGSSNTTGHFVIFTGSTALTTGTTYTWHWHCSLL